MKRILISCFLLVQLIIGGFSPLTALAQPAQPLPPVPNYSDRDLANENLGSCGSALSLSMGGSGICATAITTEASLIGLPARGLTLSVGDVMRCVSSSFSGFAGSYGSYGNISVVCTATHPDGSADTAAELGLTSGGGLIASRTDSSGNTTPANGSDNLVDRAGDSIADTAVGALKSVADTAITGIASLILEFSTLLLGWAGSLLNWVMLRGVFQFSLLIGNSPGLLLAWGILRDLGNILLLFGFIFIGVSTILGTSKFGDKKALPKLLIFAILMNFSLFAAEAVIDSANLLASTMYTQASIDSCTGIEGGPAQLGVAGSDTVKDCALEQGIAGHMIQSTGLASVYAADNPAVGPATMVGLAAFVTIGAVVIFATSFMLITRAVILTFLMITSPIGFAGMALPPMQKFAKQWWSKLLNQAFYAPILILMILISLKITDSFTSDLINGRNLGAAIQEPTAASMGVLFVFALAIGFLVASIVAAKKFGAAGSDFAMNMVNKTARIPVRAARGAGSFVGRNTVGKSSRWLQQGHNRAMANSPKWQQKAMIGLGLDRAINSTLEKGKNAKYGGSRSLEQREKDTGARLKELGEVARKDKKGREVGDADAASKAAALRLENARKGGDGAAIKAAEEEKETANDTLAQALEGLTAKEIEELGVLNKSRADLRRIAESLSPEKFGALVKDGSGISETKKEELRKARFQKINDVISPLAESIRKSQETISNPSASDSDKKGARDSLADSTKKIRAVTKDYSAKDLQNMSAEDLNNDALLMNLTNSQRDDLLKSNNISPATARKIKRYDPVEQVKTVFNATATTDKGMQTKDRMREMKLNTTQVARLGIDVLASEEVARSLKVSEIKAIEKREEFGTDERSRLKEAIEKAGNVDVRKYMVDSERGRENWT